MIAIIKYNAGNIKSVENAVRRLGFDCLVTDDAESIKSAEKVIFPGVGEASTAMTYLRQHGLDNLIRSLKQPVLGICLGQQLLCEHSEEGDTQCLGIFKAKVRKFPPEDLVPHIGWNSLAGLKGQLFEGVRTSDDVYFVHSYYAELSPDTIATCQYILPFSAAMHHSNFFATQFHPEKSASVGAVILKNFLQIR